jgi:hypothetical protein
VAMQKNGATTDQLTAQDAKAREEFIKLAGRMGITGQAAQDLANKYYGIPEQRKTLISAAGADVASQQVSALIQMIARLTGKNVVITTVEDNVKVSRSYDARTGTVTSATFWTPNGPVRLNEEGGITGRPSKFPSKTKPFFEAFASGGTRLPSQATIAPPGANLVQWAEQGTGGEAFIPLASAKRQKAMQVLAEVARMFGAALVTTGAGTSTTGPDIAQLLSAAGLQAGSDFAGVGPRVLNTAAAVQSGQASTTVNRGFTVHNLNVNNPRAERASRSLPRAIRAVSYRAGAG